MTHIEVLPEERLKGYANGLIKNVASYAKDKSKGIWINAVSGTDEFYTKVVKGLFDYNSFTFPNADGRGYCAFMIPKERVPTLSLPKDHNIGGAATSALASSANSKDRFFSTAPDKSVPNNNGTDTIQESPAYGRCVLL